MTSKKLIWFGFFIGSTVGGMIPSLWTDELISVSAIVFSTLGGIVGIWAGYRVARYL